MPRASLLDVRGVVVTVAALWCGRGVGQVLCDVVKGGVLASHDPQAKDNAQQVLPSDLRISFNLFVIVGQCDRYGYGGQLNKRLLGLRLSDVRGVQVPVFSSNPDLVFSSHYPTPRLAQGITRSRHLLL